jgi:probable rRNA maturation factor
LHRLSKRLAVIDVVSRQRLLKIDRDRVGQLAADVLAAVGRTGVAATIAIVRDPRIRALNRRYRDKDRATDVLSFPSGSEEESGLEDGNYLGDVVISADTALRQASRAGHSIERELSELVIHGILHLCGYDHESDRGQMNRLELKLRRKLLGRGQGSGVGDQGKE